MNFSRVSWLTFQKNCTAFENICAAFDEIKPCRRRRFMVQWQALWRRCRHYYSALKPRTLPKQEMPENMQLSRNQTDKLKIFSFQFKGLDQSYHQPVLKFPHFFPASLPAKTAGISKLLMIRLVTYFKLKTKYLYDNLVAIFQFSCLKTMNFEKTGQFNIDLRISTWIIGVCSPLSLMDAQCSLSFESPD